MQSCIGNRRHIVTAWLVFQHNMKKFISWMTIQNWFSYSMWLKKKTSQGNLGKLVSKLTHSFDLPIWLAQHHTWVYHIIKTCENVLSDLIVLIVINIWNSDYSQWCILQVFRSKELRLEADVGVNCSKADQLIYMWKVFIGRFLIR